MSQDHPTSNPRTDLPLSLRTWCDPAVGARLSNRAADEIERLSREIAHRDELEKFTAPLSCTTHGLVPNLGLFENKCPACERDRLKAALLELVRCKALREKIDGELSACHQEMSPQLQAMENEYQLRKPLAWRDARAALNGEPTLPSDLYVELGGIVHMLGNEEDIESAIQNLEAIMERQPQEDYGIIDGPDEDWEKALEQF